MRPQDEAAPEATPRESCPAVYSRVLRKAASQQPAIACWPPSLDGAGQGGVGQRLTLECLLGESLPAASCLEGCLLPMLPVMAESLAWAGTCHRGSAGKEETHRWGG